MRTAEQEATKAAVFKALDREPMTAKMAGELFGIGHATFERWKAEWKKKRKEAA